jgi:cytochrome c oxidase subunit 2
MSTERVRMRVHPYEKAWMAAAGGLIAVGLATILYAVVVESSAPPSHIETIDPTTALTDPRFTAPGVVQNADGSTTVVVLAQMFAFTPREIRVPARRPVTFRMTSADVIHGFQVVGTNGNAMVVPGYVTEFTTTFEPGDYLIVCNEFCGLAHHVMQGRLVAEVAP